ncbi:hypothetical protein Tco_1224239 [Tanacetum coccineum]
MSREIMNIAVNSVDILDINRSCVDECTKCLEIKTELFKKKDFVEREVYDKHVKSYSTLEKHCISLEPATQLNQEIFQRDNSSESQNGPTFNEFHTVQSKEQCDSLIAQINAKSVANSDLNAQLQEKVFVIAALKNELMKLKGKNVVDSAVSKPIATTNAPGMYKLDIQPISPRLKNNRDVHEELLVYTSKTCPDSPKLNEKLVPVTPMNKDKRVRFTDPLTSSSNTQITKDSNKHMLHSTGVKCSTHASGSKPSGNTKNNRISQSLSSNKTNKVEDHSRNVKSRNNKKNRVDKTKCNAHVMQSMLNANSVSEPISNALVKHSVRNAKF